MMRYSKRELNYMKNNYKEKSHKEIAKKLGRSYKSISTKLNKMGLIKRPQNYKDVEKQILKEPQLRSTLEKKYGGIKGKIRIIRLKNPKIRSATLGLDDIYFLDDYENRVKAYKLAMKSYPDFFKHNVWVQGKGILGNMIKTKGRGDRGIEIKG